MPGTLQYDTEFLFPNGTGEDWAITELLAKPIQIKKIVVSAYANGEYIADNYHWQHLTLWMSKPLVPPQAQTAVRPADADYFLYAPETALGQTDLNVGLSKERDNIYLLVPAQQQVRFWVRHVTNGAAALDVRLLVTSIPAP